MSRPFPPRLATGGFLVLRGRGISPGRACGPLRRNGPEVEPDRVSGAVLVAERAVPDDVARILAAAGTLTIQGAPLSHVGLLAREFGKPCVALGADRLGRLVAAPGGGRAILELTDVVGAEGIAVLEEDDVVLIDGGTGTILVPGALDRGARSAVREALRDLAALGASPADGEALARLAGACAGSLRIVLPFTLEAAFEYGALPDRRGRSALLAALRAEARLRDGLPPLVEDMRERIAAELRSLGDRALQAVRAHEDPVSLERGFGGFRDTAARLQSLLEDLGDETVRAASVLEPARAEAAIRRSRMVEAAHADVEAARGLEDPAFVRRIGEMYGLVRRARALGIEAGAVLDVEERLARLVARERERAGSRLVVPLEEGLLLDRSIVGGKAAGLVEVRAALPEGCRIPAGFVVTTAAYRVHVLGERGERLRQALSEGPDEATLSRRARAILLAGDLPEGLPRDIVLALDRLGGARLAVRSSATVEDGPEGSLAGLCDSWLGVSGPRDVLDRVRRCWASLWNARVLRALAASGVSPLDAAQAVLVQEMVPVRAAGVLFTREPAGNPGTMLVNAAWGLGEAISSGEIDGDLFWVRRASGQAIATERGTASRRISLDPDRPGTREEPLSPEAARSLCLDEEDLERLAALARALEAATGRAQDVEFGFAEDGSLVVFQTRRLVAPPR